LNPVNVSGCFSGWQATLLPRNKARDMCRGREGFRQMFLLIYTSRAQHPFRVQHPFCNADLKKLLVRVRSNNEKIDVTGMLVYHDGAFLQALEGEESAVRNLFKRIETDARHTGVAILRDQSSFGEQRVFGEWSMGFANALSNAQVLKGFVDLHAGQNLLMLNETQAIELLYFSSRIPQNGLAHA
jgi:hypothetical protein